MDLAFVFDNIAHCEAMNGGSADAYQLASSVSKAWVQFATTGNPNHENLPHWPAYTPENGAVMILDSVCEVRNHHDRDLMEIAATAK
jgi:para-nitrobenzyl esterase